MSLINEALKKAQRERASHAETVAGPASVAGTQQVERRILAGPPGYARPSGPSAGVILGSISVVLAALALGLVFWKAGPTAADSAPAAPVAAVTPVAAPAVPTPAPAVAPVPMPVTAPLVAAPTPAPTGPAPLFSEPPPLTVALPSAPVASPLPATPPPAFAAPAPAVTVAPTPDHANAVAAWLEDLSIQSVRFAGPDSRVLIRNRVFALGSTVERSLGLRVAEIHPNRIVFIDDAGTEFIKFL